MTHDRTNSCVGPMTSPLQCAQLQSLVVSKSSRWPAPVRGRGNSRCSPGGMWRMGRPQQAVGRVVGPRVRRVGAIRPRGADSERTSGSGSAGVWNCRGLAAQAQAGHAPSSAPSRSRWGGRVGIAGSAPGPRAGHGRGPGGEPGLGASELQGGERIGQQRPQESERKQNGSRAARHRGSVAGRTSRASRASRQLPPHHACHAACLARGELVQPSGARAAAAAHRQQPHRHRHHHCRNLVLVANSRRASQRPWPQPPPC